MDTEVRRQYSGYGRLDTVDIIEEETSEEIEESKEDENDEKEESENEEEQKDEDTVQTDAEEKTEGLIYYRLFIPRTQLGARTRADELSSLPLGCWGSIKFINHIKPIVSVTEVYYKNNNDCY